MNTPAPGALATGVLAVVLSACLRDSNKELTEPPPCPSDIDSFCAFEFGGPCPTFDEAAAMTCDGHHFDASGGTGAAPNVTVDAEDCTYPMVSCITDEPRQYTRVYFAREGDGEIQLVGLGWFYEPVCTGRFVLGDGIC